MLGSRHAPKEAALLFMVIETFRNQDAAAVYRRFREKGRQCPEGVRFVDSWVSADRRRCFQLMDADDFALLEMWTGAWADLVEFELVPVVSGAVVAEAMAREG